MKIHQQSKNKYFQEQLLKKRTMFSLWEKKTSSQKMQKSTTREIHKNTNTDNYNRTNMWKKIMSKHEISIASFKTKSSQESIMI